MKDPTTTDATMGVPPKPGAGQNGAEKILSVPLDEIVRSPFNRTIDPKTLDPEFIESIGTRGIIQPLIVRPVPGRTFNRLYELIAGERRLTAARLKKLDTAPVEEREQ